ncbi:hypothetical protein DMB92_08920 [Campylobacter sp. MIT 99-7217]|uniref:glycosyltransferase n=1 Tax=Campylobacter sp. MIT 99-7217 TaxID=535091 RepID=UPI001157A17F|nr:glycosyltransferase family 4 protein [Campylobacter sp. MIT 99-7217]TQR28849.1 hypothetical protein DMB92_08920 [Campylobacter sp. MIT 99-7217]
MWFIFKILKPCFLRFGGKFWCCFLWFLPFISAKIFSSKKYANDLSIKAILELSKKDFFKDLSFKIIGDGELFDELVKPLKEFKNISIEKRFLRQNEISKLHKEYGIFLNPTRWDSQGVSRDEAMSSGLVPITNKLAAIFIAKNEIYRKVA